MLPDKIQEIYWVHFNSNHSLEYDRRELKETPKKKQKKVLILLSNQVTIIDTEWSAMKIYRKHYYPKPIIEMLPTDGRLIAQHGKVLDNLLHNTTYEPIKDKQEEVAA